MQLTKKYFQKPDKLDKSSFILFALKSIKYLADKSDKSFFVEYR